MTLQKRKQCVRALHRNLPTSLRFMFRRIAKLFCWSYVVITLCFLVQCQRNCLRLIISVSHFRRLLAQKSGVLRINEFTVQVSHVNCCSTWSDVDTVARLPFCGAIDHVLDYLFDGGGGLTSTYTQTHLKEIRASSIVCIACTSISGKNSMSADFSRNLADFFGLD